MEQLSDYTRKLRKNIERDHAMLIIDRAFERCGSRPQRFFEGVAISSNSKNASGDSYNARLVKFALPTPLLWNHLWDQPIGRVFSIEVWGERIFFKAELPDTGSLDTSQNVWVAAVTRSLVSISIGANVPGICDEGSGQWSLDEISVVERGADFGANITRVWERERVIRLDRRSATTVHWSQ